MSDFRMPSLGADMEGGKIVEWLKQPGDRVHHGEVIAVVETEKGAIEIEVFEDGILRDIAATLGDYREVGDVLAHIEAETSTAAPIDPPPTRAQISPAARRRAGELGVDLAQITGTGPGGAITIADVDKNTTDAGGGPRAATEPAERSKEGIDLTRMRAAIATAMARSKREIPHYYVAATIDVTAMTHWLTARNEAAPIAERVLPLIPLIKAAARALEQVPTLNGTWGTGDNDGFHESADINIGVAIALRGGGLVAPAILGTDGLSIDTLMAKLRDLSGRVRRGTMRGSELSRSTFTVSSVGEGNVESLVPIIYPPQVAILGLGSISERPWVADGDVRPRQLVTATLAGDHRASDGRVGARFLDLFDRLLQEPEAL